MKDELFDVGDLFYFVHDGFEGLGVVHGQICQHFAVEFDLVGFDFSHKLAVGHTVCSGTSINSGDPKRSEVSFFGFSVAVGVKHGFFYGVFGHGPDVFTSSKITFGLFEDFFSSSSGSYCIY